MKKIIALLSLIISVPEFVFSQKIDNKFWETDGKVNTVIKQNNRIFLGGKFNYVGPNTGASVIFNKNSNSWYNTDLKIMGQVNVIIKDSITGRIFIGGEFSSMGRTNLMVLNADGSLNSLNLPVNGPVKALCVTSDGLLVGGLFDKIGNVNRNNCAAIDLTDGHVMSVNPNPDGEVRAFTVAGAEVIMGGAFTKVMNQTRNGIASFSISSSNLQSLNNSINGIVNCLVYENGKLFIGGEFSRIDTSNRTNFAVIDLSLNVVMPINPEINGVVNSIALNSNSIFIGGVFNEVGGTFRNNIVEIDKQTGIPSLFDPSPSGEVKTIAMTQNSLFVGGNFSYVGNNEVSNYVELNLAGEYVSSTRFNNTIHSLIVNSDTVVAGGVFSSFNGQIRNNFAALDYETGALLSYAPEVNDEIKSIQIYGNSLALGGKFSIINNVLRNGFALIDTILGDPIANSADISGQVNKVFIAGNTAYLAGLFESVNGTTRNNFAKVSLIDGSLYPLNLFVDGEVTNIENYGSYLYLMGNFSQVNDSLRRGICRLNLFDNSFIDAWNPKVNAQVNDMIQTNEKVMIGGAFNQINGISSNSFAVLDTQNAQVIQVFNSPIGFEIGSMEFDGDIIYLSDLNGANGISTFHISNGQYEDIHFKGESQSINEIKFIDDYLFVSGSYKLNNGNIRNNFSGIKMSVSAPDIASSNINFTNISPLGMRIHFKPGNGEKHLVIGHQGSQVNQTPIDGVDYFGSKEYGQGSTLGNGNFVLSNSIDTVIDVNALNKSTEYHFAVYEANGIGTFVKYLKTAVVRGSASTIAGYDPPTQSATNLIADEIRTNSMKISWQNGNGAKRIVLAREGSAVNQIPSDSSSYFSSVSFGDGYELGTGNFVIYNGSENQVQIFNLKPGTNYYFSVFEYNGIEAFERVKKNNPLEASFTTLSPALEPTQAASNLTFSEIGTESVRLKWVSGNGQGRIIIASESVEPSSLPTDGEIYFTDSTFNGQSSSFSEYEKVIYVGSGDSTIVKGLKPGTTYFFGIIEYNGSGFTINYANQLSASGSVKMKVPGTPPINPSKAIVFTKVTSDSMYLKWTAGIGQGRVMIIKKGGFPSAKPFSGLSYIANSEYGKGDSLSDGSFVVYDGDSNEAVIANLEPNTIYGIEIFDYNIGDFGNTYQVDSFAYALKATLPVSGLERFLKNETIKIYPNPVANILQLEFLKPLTGKTEIKISDIAGKYVLETVINTNSINNSYQIDVSSLTEGNYYLTIINKKNKMTQAFIISN
jgi:hypothetical protein